jgi:hypothetical protein
MTKDEDWNDEQLLVNICNFWKWTLMLNCPAAGIAPTYYPAGESSWPKEDREQRSDDAAVPRSHTQFSV